MGSGGLGVMKGKVDGRLDGVEGRGDERVEGRL